MGFIKWRNRLVPPQLKPNGQLGIDDVRTRLHYKLVEGAGNAPARGSNLEQMVYKSILAT
jgi:hypothetical protein